MRAIRLTVPKLEFRDAAAGLPPFMIALCIDFHERRASANDRSTQSQGKSSLLRHHLNVKQSSHFLKGVSPDLCAKPN
jgi:hypothetical protein